MSDHAATCLNQWNSGRAALSSSSRNNAADVPHTQLRPTVPTLHPRSNNRVKNTVTARAKEGEAADVNSPTLISPMSVTKGLISVDVVMIDPDVKILEHEEPRRYKAWAVSHNPWTMGMAKGAEKAGARAPEPIPRLRSDATISPENSGLDKCLMLGKPVALFAYRARAAVIVMAFSFLRSKNGLPSSRTR